MNKFFVFRMNNNVKAHLASYPSLTSLYASSLKYFSVGFLFSFNVLTLVVFLFSIRESLFSTFSSLLTSMLSFIISEALLFITYFWGIFHFTLSPYPLYSEGIILTSSRMLILTITFILASASCMTACVQFLIDKGMSFKISNIVCIIFITGECFATLQVTEYLHLSYNINDAMITTLFYLVTGLHFMHVVVGLLFLSIYFIRLTDVYNVYNNVQSVFGTSYVVLNQSDQITLLYWHFVEIVWLFIKFLFYTE
nr:cytochrome c oxidase subunit III [Leucocytozoon sp.]